MAEPHKRPRSSIIRFAAEQPNERWRADVTAVQIAQRHEAEVLNQLDDHSRLLVGSDVNRSVSFLGRRVVDMLPQARGGGVQGRSERFRRHMKNLA